MIKKISVLFFLVGLKIALLNFQNCAAINFDAEDIAKDQGQANVIAAVSPTCEQLTCPDPGPNCRYVNQQVDDNGCTASGLCLRRPGS